MTRRFDPERMHAVHRSLAPSSGSHIAAIGAPKTGGQATGTTASKEGPVISLSVGKGAYSAAGLGGEVSGKIQLDVRPLADTQSESWASVTAQACVERQAGTLGAGIDLLSGQVGVDFHPEAPTAAETTFGLSLVFVKLSFKMVWKDKLGPTGGSVELAEGLSTPLPFIAHALGPPICSQVELYATPTGGGGKGSSSSSEGDGPSGGRGSTDSGGAGGVDGNVEGRKGPYKMYA